MALAEVPGSNAFQNPSEVSDDFRHNHLRVYDDFAKRYIEQIPVRRLEKSRRTASYDHLDYFGSIHYDNSSQEGLMVVIRESSRVVERCRQAAANLGYDRQKDVDAKGYFIATTDGTTTTEWTVADARWKIGKAFWLAGETPRDELVMELRPVGGSPDDELGAEMWLSRTGGTFRFLGDNDSGWLVGEGRFEDGPEFLDDPVS